MTADAFGDLDDAGLLQLAASHLRAAEAFDEGTPQSARERAEFHRVMGEFSRRELRRVMRELAGDQTKPVGPS